jgi:uncharacterized protein with ParB-like and HNH nuclease domain
MNSLQPSIIKVKELLQIKMLKIPEYQRPYKWTIKNVNQLIDDILFHSNKSAYRLGTLVIHGEINDGKNILNIVDGQQRTLTLALIAYAIIQYRKDILINIFARNENIENYCPCFLDIAFTNDITKTNIQNNYKEITRRINEFDEKAISFFYNKCELVQVILSDISEAFQFFDSQNARGKDLEPHDLLKAFHLREMNNSSTEEERQKAVENWEEMDTNELSKLFSLYLYRIRNWSNGFSAKYFTKNDVDVFKGISPNIMEDYPFARIFRIAHYYTEDYNFSVHKNINQNKLNYPFQIDQTIINGKRFFEMIDYYNKMVNKIKDIKDNQTFETIKNYEGCYRAGDKYVRNLFYCGLIYYIDKFGDWDRDNLSKAIDKIFIWAYSLRLKLSKIYLNSIDNYALGKAHSQVKLFKTIREAINPNEILNIKLDVLQKEQLKREIGEIVKLFIDRKYYE